MCRPTLLLLVALLAMSCTAPPPEAAPAPQTPDPALFRARAAVGEALDRHAEAEQFAAIALDGFRAVENLHLDLSDADRVEDAAQQWDDAASRWAAAQEALEQLARGRAETRAALVPARRALAGLEGHDHEDVARYATTELGALEALEAYLDVSQTITAFLREHEATYARMAAAAGTAVEQLRSGDTTPAGAASTYRTAVGDVLESVNALNDALEEAEGRRALRARAADDLAQAAQRTFEAAQRPPPPDDA